MATYLIDFENVKSEGIKGITQLDSNDTVVIFYSQNADTLTFEAMDMIFSTKAAVRKYKILRGGKNALDFQLSTYLGYLIREGNDSYFYIISKDNGFQHVVEFWKRTFGYDGYVFCFPTIGDGNARQNKFRNASDRERQMVIEKDLEAMHQALDEEELEEEATREAAQAYRDETAENVPLKNDDRFFNIYPSEELHEEMNKQQRKERSRRYEAERAQKNAAREEQAAEPVKEAAPVPEEKAEPAVKPEAEPEEESKAPVSRWGEAPAEEETVQGPDDDFVDTAGVSVMPPEEMPDSVRESLRLADEQAAKQAADNPEKEAQMLESAIAAAAPVSEMKVVTIDNNLTVHVVAESEKTEEPAAEAAPAAAAEEKPASHRRTHRGGRKNAKAAEKAEEQAAAPAKQEDKPAGETVKKAPAKRSAKKSQEKADAEKAENEAEKPAEKKPARRSTRKSAEKAEAGKASAEDKPAAEENAPAADKPAATKRRVKKEAGQDGEAKPKTSRRSRQTRKSADEKAAETDNKEGNNAGAEHTEGKAPEEKGTQNQEGNE